MVSSCATIGASAPRAPNVIEPRATGLIRLQCLQVQRGKRPGAHDRRTRRLGLRFEAVGNRRRDIGGG